MGLAFSEERCIDRFTCAYIWHEQTTLVFKYIYNYIALWHTSHSLVFCQSKKAQMCSAMRAWVPHKVTELSILQKEGVLKCMCSSVWELFGPGKETETLRERGRETVIDQTNLHGWKAASLDISHLHILFLTYVIDRYVIYVWNKHKGYIKQHNTHDALVTISITLTLREPKKHSKFERWAFEVCRFCLRSLQVLTSKFDILTTKFANFDFEVWRFVFEVWSAKILRFS